MTAQPGTTEKITVYVEPQLKRELKKIADAKGRDLSAQARVALATFALRELEKSGSLRAEGFAKGLE